MTEPIRRRMALSDILEGGAVLVARNLLVFLRITAPLLVPVNLVLAAVLLGVGSRSVPKALSDTFIVAYALLFVFTLIFALGACVKTAADIRVQAETSARGSLSLVRGRLSSICWLVLISLIGIGPGLALYLVARSRPLGGAGYLALILIPLALWLAGIWSVALPSLLLEGSGVVEALRRSRALVRRSYFRSLGTVVFGSVLAIFVVIVFVLIASVFAIGSRHAKDAVLICGGTIGGLAAVPLLAAYLVLLYRDLRSRHERVGPEQAG